MKKMNMSRLHNTMEDKTMNYVRFFSLALLFLATPAAMLASGGSTSANTALHTRAIDAVKAHPYISSGVAVAVVGTVGVVVVHKYWPAFRKNV